jgi:hypothetical protein
VSQKHGKDGDLNLLQTHFKDSPNPIKSKIGLAHCCSLDGAQRKRRKEKRQLSAILRLPI